MCCQGTLLKEQDARCKTKARKLGVCTPMLYIVGPVLHTLTFEYVEGPSVKDVFLEFGSRDVDKECMDNIASQIGHAIGKLHDCGLVHGDLTTSNILKEWYQSVVCALKLIWAKTLGDKVYPFSPMSNLKPYDYGLDTCCIPQVIKAVLIHIEQTSTSKEDGRGPWLDEDFRIYDFIIEIYKRDDN
ncbi:hypothetical protein JHK85_004911 [Glycine max]|uniref:non-specific serine/threonine protein kinase n=1 Tax=Glycine soja TaxID=3848 RepID=A0A0B2NUZ1_GLYSO|nr:hypothetical protein JHK85_004911 [Glycine max]KAG5080681.1 hypothetical protein JHK86_004746 [Glycine max]KHM99271.1 TP53-regulating kinase [Glycine soja]